MSKKTKSEREAQRGLDVGFILGEYKPGTEELNRLNQVWERAYQMGIWAGYDLTVEHVHQALSTAGSDAGAGDLE